MPADEVGVPLLAQHAEPRLVDVGTDHRPAEPRQVVPLVTCASRCWRLRVRQRLPGDDADVVKPRLAGDGLQTHDQGDLLGVFGDDGAEGDLLPVERARAQFGGRPGLLLVGHDRGHELHAVIRLRFAADVLGP